MNIEKMQQIVQLFNELGEEDGVYGFHHGSNEFHVDKERLVNEPNLKIQSRGSDDYPYEIYVQHDGFKVFSILKAEQLKNFPQFKEQEKEKLRKQLDYLEEDVILDGMGGEEHATA